MNKNKIYKNSQNWQLVPLKERTSYSSSTFLSTKNNCNVWYIHLIIILSAYEKLPLNLCILKENGDFNILTKEEIMFLKGHPVNFLKSYFLTLHIA